jgi:hypothetical protein
LEFDTGFFIQYIGCFRYYNASGVEEKISSAWFPWNHRFRDFQLLTHECDFFFGDS